MKLIMTLTNSYKEFALLFKFYIRAPKCKEVSLTNYQLSNVCSYIYIYTIYYILYIYTCTYICVINAILFDDVNIIVQT